MSTTAKSRKKWFTILLLGLLAAAIATTWLLGQPAFDAQLDEKRVLSTIRIAPVEEAITLARLLSGEVILARDADEDGVIGIALSPDSGNPFVDAIDAYNALGLNQLRVAATNRQAPAEHYSWEQLGTPLNGKYPHIAAGTNYRAHAQEVGHEGDPFVFPKLSRITAWNADVSNGTRLDYEVELCAVPLTTHTPDDPARLGFLLCGDYTDRWLLIKEMDISAPMGPTGFPAGKGGETRFPVGALLVIPEAGDFYKDIQLELYVNQDLRQRSSAGLMIWSPERVLNQSLADCEVPYYVGPEQIAVTASCEEIPARTLLLTGTPAGVMFHVATLWNPLSYLRGGDVVTSAGTYLGIMRNTIK